MNCYPYLIALGVLLLPSCTRDDTKTLDSTDKILCLGEQLDEGSFFVKFSRTPAQEEILSFQKECGISLQRIFISVPGKEELEKKHGLDRWFSADVPEGENLNKIVLKAASMPSVSLVQYDSRMEKSSDGAVFPVNADTKKASDGAFNDPYLSFQWHYINTGDNKISPKILKGADINVKPVWDNLCTGDPDIVVAVIDEAVKYSHPDLRDNMWVNAREIPGNGIDDDGNGYIDDVYGYNFVNNTAELSWAGNEDSGHGTHCAGTIAAVNNNALGVSGIAGGSGNKDGCRIMSCQIFSGRSGASVKNIAAAIKYAADNGASIISCSFGSTVSFSSDNAYIKAGGGVELDAIHYFEDCKNNPVLNGNIAIFAASNDAKNYAYYPGAFADIISVSALGPDGLPAYYTNYGPGCDICAPGGEAFHVVNKWNSMVLSTIPSEVAGNGINGEYNESGLDYGYMQGTSMACPHVSGVVALALSYAKKIGKTFDRDAFKQMILSSVNDVDQLIARTSEKTYAYSKSPLKMAPYYHQMGTGSIDAWRLMMKIEGIPSLTATLDKSQWIDLTPIFGTASVSLTYLNVEVPETTATALGLQKIKGNSSIKYPCIPEDENYAYIQYGRLYLHPTKIGSGKIRITAVGGGDHLGGGDNPPGGMELTQEISLIARDVDGGNGTGGWL